MVSAGVGAHSIRPDFIRALTDTRTVSNAMSLYDATAKPLGAASVSFGTIVKGELTAA